jgi:hypothetical protein
MQKITVKEIIPSPGDNKPTIITDTSGTKMSGFESGLKTLKPGDIIDVEIEVKGKFVNIKSYKPLEQAPPAGPPSGQATDANIQYRITALTLAVHYTDAKHEPAQVFTHADSFYDWLTGRKGKAAVQEKTAEQEWEGLESGSDKHINPKQQRELIALMNSANMTAHDLWKDYMFSKLSDLTISQFEEVKKKIEKGKP